MAKLKVLGNSGGSKKTSRPKFKKAGKTNIKKGAKTVKKKNFKKGEKEKKDPDSSKVQKGKTLLRKRSLENDEDTSVTKKPKITPLTRREKDKKKLTVRKERKLPTDSFDKINKAKQLWEHLRRHDMEKSERDKFVKDIMDLINIHIYKLALKHDTARIIQCLLKFGSQEMRREIFTQLKDHVVELSKMKYAKFVVKALFRYSTPVLRSQLITCYYTHVPSLVRHKEAVELIELAYNDYANASERSLLVQEFYGPQFALFKDNSGRSLGDILSTNPEEKDKLIGHMKQALLPLLDKSLVRHNIVHQALLEFITHADESSISDIMETLREVAVEMLHTREGAKVNLQCLWKGTAKDRKVYVKSLKPYVTKICKEEHGHLVLLGIFDTVDDTVLVNKNILTEIISSLEEICTDRHGRRVLLYLLSPRSPSHFSQQFLSLLTPGDNNAYSKKPQATRWAELRSIITPPLIKLATIKATEWACHKQLAPLLIEIVKSSNDDVTCIYSNLCESLMYPLKEEDGEKSGCGHIISDPCGHWVLKKLLLMDEKGKGLADMMIECLSQSTLLSWVSTNRGCFVLASLLSAGVINKTDTTTSSAVSKLINTISEVLREEEGGGKGEGRTVLMKTIK